MTSKLGASLFGAFRLLGAVLGHLHFKKLAPLGTGSLPFLFGRGRALSSEGLLFIMQDTPKSYLEVERRFFLLGREWVWLGQEGDAGKQK